ncbi:hypothetical protein C3369_07610 [Escherichia sp. ESNIH1]|uniref:hypothetical protein n=1 Tax=Escherichia sp. ESNIH1 TaxID=1985876 RepID=UPI000CDD78A6|nr:hypothetical protein [Escherichia sp. ESNIH1]POU02324.1 hypothetical protein C3369_07610 [Escherichia sp. ESNIH1]
MANTVKGTVSLEVLSRRYGVDKSTVSRDWKGRGFNIKASEREIDEWIYENHLKPKSILEKKESQLDQDIRYTRIKADIAELEKLQKEEKLVDTDEVTELLTQHLFLMKNAMRSIPTGIYLELAECETPLEMRQLLQDKIDSVLMEIGQFKYEQNGTDSEEGSPNDSATKED